jgi:hypothetical protein
MRPPALLATPAKTLKETSLSDVGDFDEFERHAQIRLVGTVTIHRLAVGRRGKGLGSSTAIAFA